MDASETSPPGNGKGGCDTAPFQKTQDYGAHLTIPGLLVKHTERLRLKFWRGFPSAREVIRTILVKKGLN
jgi:hypothetical protein